MADITNPQTDASQLTMGTLPAGRMPALTGDVTTSAGAVATTIANAAVTNAKLANMATTTIKGQTVGGSGAPVDLTATQAAAIIGSVGGTLKSKIISSTRDLTAATASVAYTGVGFQPTSCFAFGQVSQPSIAYNSLFGLGDSGKTAVVLWSQSVAAVGNYAITSGNLMEYVDATGASGQTASISSYDSDGLTLSWTKVGTPTGTATFYILLFR